MEPQAPSPDRLPLCVCGLFLLIGTGFLASGLCWFLQTALFLGRARLSTGVVIGEERSTSIRVVGRARIRSTQVLPAPVVIFRDADGVSHRFRALASSRQSTAGGERLQVVYNPLQPERASIRSFDALWMRPLLLTGFGSLTAAASAGMLWMVQRLQNPADSGSRQRR